MEMVAHEHLENPSLATPALPYGAQAVGGTYFSTLARSQEADGFSAFSVAGLLMVIVIVFREI